MQMRMRGRSGDLDSDGV